MTGSNIAIIDGPLNVTLLQRQVQLLLLLLLLLLLDF
jgi:hypothetical protein